MNIELMWQTSFAIFIVSGILSAYLAIQIKDKEFRIQMKLINCEDEEKLSSYQQKSLNNIRINSNRLAITAWIFLISAVSLIAASILS